MSTFAQLKENVSNELGLDQTASGTEDVLLGRRLNEGVREVLKKTHVYVTTGNLTITGGTAFAISSSDVLALTNLVDNDSIPVERISHEEILDLRRSAPAVGTNFFRYALLGSLRFELWPTPSANATWTYYYVPKPTEMSSGSHDPSDTTYGQIPVDLHPLIEYWACYRMASYDDDSSSQVGQVYKQLFDQGVFEARRDIQRRGGRKLGPVRMPRRNRPNRDPSRT